MPYAIPEYSPKIPDQPNYYFTAYLCKKRKVGPARLPEGIPLEDSLWVGMRSVFKDFLASEEGQGYTIEDVLEDHCFAWTRID